jgi:hypothetical protein
MRPRIPAVGRVLSLQPPLKAAPLSVQKPAESRLQAEGLAPHGGAPWEK